MFERFTDRARRVVVLAQDEARQFSVAELAAADDGALPGAVTVLPDLTDTAAVVAAVLNGRADLPAA